MRQLLPKILILLVVIAGVWFWNSAPALASPSNPTEACMENPNIPSEATNAPCEWKFCWDSSGALFRSGISEENCKKEAYFWGTKSEATAKFKNISGLNPNGGVAAAQAQDPKERTAFENAIEAKGCTNLFNFDMAGCVAKVAYYGLYVPLAFILAQTAYFFNVMISITLSSDLLKGKFVSDAWAVVRDLSNIFFIIVLLYVAIRMIVGLAGHGIKETIVKVVVMALLINFSMFFTGVVIDTSNMLALVFYNKLSVQTKISGQEKPRDYASVQGEKDVAGGMVAAFDPTRPLSEPFFEKAKEVYIDGQYVKKEKEVPLGTLIALILIAALIMGFAVYALFISAFSFLGRLLELWILIIFSPFAFMSSSVSFLQGVEYIGWQQWSKKLLKASFMAPIFMFFLYFIFMMIDSNIFSEIAAPKSLTDQDPAGFVKSMLGIVMPTMLILVLLLKATDYAKKGAGQLGEMTAKWGGQIGGLAAGLAVGAATGGASMALQATAGRAGARMQKSGNLKDMEAAGGVDGWIAGKLRNLGGYAGAASFDARGIKVAGKSIASTGIKAGDARQGFVKNQEAQIEKRKKRAKELEVGKDEGAMQDLNNLEEAKQSMLREASHDIEQLDKKIKVWRERVKDRSDRVRALRDKGMKEGDTEFDNATTLSKEATDSLKDIQDHRKAIKDGDKTYEIKTEAAALSGQKVKDKARAITTTIIDPHTGKEKEGVSINDLEDTYIPDAHHVVESLNNRRQWNYADNQRGVSRVLGLITSGGTYTANAARQTAHDIRMKAKVKDAPKSKGGHKEEHHDDHAPKDHGHGDKGGGDKGGDPHAGGAAPAGDHH